MQEKRDDLINSEATENDGLINSLPPEIIAQIVGYFNLKDLVQTALASRASFFNVQPELILKNIAHDMSTDVAHGKQAEAELFFCDLTGYEAQSVLLTAVPFTDYSGRTFNCTAYEYAYWAKDTHMCRMLEKHMNGRTKTEMLIHCQAVEDYGLKYHQNGQENLDRSHFDLTPLKTALNNYVQGFTHWYHTENWDSLNAASRAIRRAQNDLPVHFINEYCRPDRSWDPLPPFDEPLLLPRVLTYLDCTNVSQGVEKSVFPLAVSASSDLALWRFCRARAMTESLTVWAVAKGDLKAITELDEKRTLDLEQSRVNLGWEPSAVLASNLL